MINEFSVHPTPTNNKARTIFLVTMIVGIVIAAVSCIIPLYKGIVGLVGFIFIVTALLFYTKYVAIEFYYDIVKDEDGLPLLIVRQTTGKRTSTLSRISLAEVTKVERVTRSERRAHKTERGFLKYNYGPTFSPEAVYRITVLGRYERAEIILEGTDEFANLLREYSKEARELSKIIEQNEY